MSLTFDQLRELPSPFYRVAAKALVFNEQHQLLMVLNDEGKPELPGGGWEHGETIEQCLQREFHEELGVGLKNISPIVFTYSDLTLHGWHAMRIVVRTELDSTNFVFGDGMTGVRYVTAEELPTLDYVDQADAAICSYIDQIWPK